MCAFQFLSNIRKYNYEYKLRGGNKNFKKHIKVKKKLKQAK